MENEKKGMKRWVFVTIWSVVFAVLIAVMSVITAITGYYDSVITMFMGSVGGGVTVPEGAENIDSQYFKLDYASKDELLQAENELCKQMGEEAVVMLENDGALPLAAKSKVSVFGMAGASGSSIGTGSGAAASAGASLSGSLTAAGFEVNETLLEYYQKNSTAHGGGTAAGGGSDKGDWSLGGEAPFPDSGSVAESLDSYKDAAIFVLNRNGGEGGDLARTMDNHGGSHDDNYLSLSPSEKFTLQGIKDSGKFDKIIVLVNTANAMELGELSDYGVNAVLWYGGLGTTGLTAVGEILAGTVNPSGRLVDTYVYDNFSAPAMQNFGDYRFVFDGALSDYSYTNYAEGIYVGYKYYETRYEDVVTERQNAGSYNYADTVLYPFGYGLSYTTFEWKNFDAKVENDTVKISIDIKNVGGKAGKEVVQIYFQSEYTDFDKQNGIEKSAVNLVEFAKTEIIEPNGSETVNMEFPLTDMNVYDAKINKTYILEQGDYYITAANNAHAAVNNILAAKGVASNKLVGAGDKDLVFKHEQRETEVCADGANKAVTNLFDDVALENSTYLSRNDWSVLESANAAVDGVLGAGGLTSADGNVAGKSNVMGASGVIGTKTGSSKLKAALELSGYDASGNPKAKDSYTANRTYNVKSGLELVDLRGLDYEAQEWDVLLNQMKFSEIYELFGHAGYGTIAITDSINKPKTLEYDGPTGINSFVNGARGYSFANEISLAATWNVELLEREGILIGNDAIVMSSGPDRVSGWYAPAVNIHRTAFSGRNYEYYSEDPVLSGKLVAKVIKGVQSKGMYVYLKHYALNDQETNRSTYGNVATFATEQTMRELYLKPFEYGVVEGGAKGIMTSMNRVGTTYACGSYALNTAILRDEWGFNGIVITDYTGNPGPAYSDQILASGGDLIMCSGWNANTGVLSDFNAEWARAELRRAARNVLYIQANSLAMNGFVHGAIYDPGFPVYKIILIAAWILVAAGIAVGGFFVYRTLFWSQDKWYARKRISKTGWIIIGAVAAAAVIALIVVVCVWLVPALSKALVQ